MTLRERMVEVERELRALTRISSQQIHDSGMSPYYRGRYDSFAESANLIAAALAQPEEEEGR